MKEALKLVSFGNDGKLMINKEATKILVTLDEVCIVVVVGSARQGKSYLMNHLVGSTAFKVAESNVPCTSGIDMFSEPLTQPGTNRKIIILDSEGRDDVHTEGKDDIKIFSLAVLLGSYFIVNSAGFIKRSSLEVLEVIIDLTKHILGHLNSGQNVSQFMPNLLWVVRDTDPSVLRSARDKCLSVSPKEYLEECLSMRNAREEIANETRQILSQFFPNRDCVIIPNPNCNPAQPGVTISPAFSTAMDRLREHVLRECVPKCMVGGNSRPISGQGLVVLLEQFVEALNNHTSLAALNITVSWSKVAQYENEKLITEEFQNYCDFMQEHLTEPLEVEELLEASASVTSVCVQRLLDSGFGDKMALQECQETLRKQISAHFKVIADKNKANSLKFCKAVLQELLQNAQAKAQTLTLDGFKQFYKNISRNFEDKARGPGKVEIGRDLYDRLLDGFGTFFDSNLQKRDAEIEEKKKELAEAQKELFAAVQSQADVKVKQVEEAQSILQQLAEAQKEKLLAEQNLKHVTDLLSQAKLLLDEKKADSKELKEKLSRLATDLQTAKTEKITTQTGVEILKVHLDHAKSNTDRVQGDLHKEQVRSSEIRDALKKEQAEIIGLTLELEKERARYVDLERTLEGTQSMSNSLNSQLEAEQVQITKLQEDLRREQEQAWIQSCTLQTEISNLKPEKDKYKTSIKIGNFQTATHSVTMEYTKDPHPNHLSVLTNTHPMVIQAVFRIPTHLSIFGAFVNELLQTDGKDLSYSVSGNLLKIQQCVINSDGVSIFAHCIQAQKVSTGLITFALDDNAGAASIAGNLNCETPILTIESLVQTLQRFRSDQFLFSTFFPLLNIVSSLNLYAEVDQYKIRPILGSEEFNSKLGIPCNGMSITSTAFLHHMFRLVAADSKGKERQDKAVSRLSHLEELLEVNFISYSAALLFKVNYPTLISEFLQIWSQMK